MIKYSTPSSLTSVPDHLPNSTTSPTFTSIGISLPASSRPPGPTAMISPCMGFSWAVSGMMIPPLVLVSSSTRRTTTRSCRGRNFMGSLSLYFSAKDGRRVPLSLEFAAGHSVPCLNRPWSQNRCHGWFETDFPSSKMPGRDFISRDQGIQPRGQRVQASQTRRRTGNST